MMSQKESKTIYCLHVIIKNYTVCLTAVQLNTLGSKCRHKVWNYVVSVCIYTYIHVHWLHSQHQYSYYSVSPHKVYAEKPCFITQIELCWPNVMYHWLTHSPILKIYPGGNTGYSLGFKSDIAYKQLKVIIYVYTHTYIMYMDIHNISTVRRMPQCWEI